MNLRIKASDESWKDRLIKSLHEEGFPVITDGDMTYLLLDPRSYPSGPKGAVYIYEETKTIGINRRVFSDGAIKILERIAKEFGLTEAGDWLQDLVFNKIGYLADGVSFATMELGIEITRGGPISARVTLTPSSDYPYPSQERSKYTMYLYSTLRNRVIREISADFDHIFDYLSKPDYQTRVVNIKKVEWFIDLVKALQKMGFKVLNGDINIWMDWEDRLDEFKNKSKR